MPETIPFELEMKGNILISTLHGVWTKKEALEYELHTQELVNHFAKETWYRIVDMTDWDLDNREVEHILVGLVIWCLTNGCNEFYYVTGNTQHKSMLMNAFKDHAGPHVYDNFQDAMDRLTVLDHGSE